MAMIAMIALATLGVFASPASAQDETDCPEGTIPLLVVEPFIDGNDGTEFDEDITVHSTTVTISGTVDFHELTFTSSVPVIFVYRTGDTLVKFGPTTGLTHKTDFTITQVTFCLPEDGVTTTTTTTTGTTTTTTGTTTGTTGTTTGTTTNGTTTGTGTTTGSTNLQATDCSQIQAIFINQFLKNEE